MYLWRRQCWTTAQPKASPCSARKLVSDAVLMEFVKVDELTLKAPPLPVAAGASVVAILSYVFEEDGYRGVDVGSEQRGVV